MAVAAAGMLAFVLQTGTMLASTACDVGAAKRMVSQMLGTVLSAAFGSQKAKDELKEMVPFYSWLMMGEQIADLWTGKKEDGSNATSDGLPDYYGAGKKAGELIVQVIGDVTILIPVVKGASMAIKAGEKVSAVLVQALKKTSGAIGRETADNFTGGMAGHVKGCRIKGLCFAPGTLVLMADGSAKRIETIQPGDPVLSSASGGDTTPEAAEVSQIQQGYAQSLVHVRIDTNGNGIADGTVKATKNHPFWVIDDGWTQARLLESGDRLIQPDGTGAVVVSVEIREGASETWDLTVSATHNFYVLCGSGAVRVHNLDKTQHRAFIIYIIPEVGTDRFYIGKASMPISAGQFGKQSIDADEVFKSRYSSMKARNRIENRQNVVLDFDNPEFPAKVFYAEPGADIDMMRDVISQLEDQLIKTHKPPSGTGKAVNTNNGINPKNLNRKNRILNNFNKFKSGISLDLLKAMGIDC